MTPIANHLWQSTFFAIAAGLLTLLFQKNRAAVRYAIWLTASVKFLLPFALLSAAAGFLAPTAPVAKSPILPVVQRIHEPFPQTSFHIVASAAAPSPSRLPALLFAIWLAGAAVISLGWLRQWLRVRTIIRFATPLALDAPVPVFSTPASLEPGIFGFLRPVLLLPDAIAQHLTPPQLRAILIHELCHVRRRDTLTVALHMLVETVFWFHPLVWWIETRLLAERERACDEDVLHQTGDAQSYAEAILGVSRLYAGAQAWVAGVTGADLTQRIESIMRYRALPRLNTWKVAILAGAALVLFAIPLIVGAQSTRRAAFEVISIKENTTPSPFRIFWNVGPGGHFRAENLTLSFLLAAAYDIPFQSSRLTGLPDWAGGARYDIEAIPEKGAIPSGLAGRALDAAMRPLLQNLLADRFHLVIRRETKDLPLYAIVRAKGDLKLKASPIRESQCVPSDDERTAVDCHNFHGGLGRGIHAKAADLDDLALFVSNWTDRPVVNRTGIAGLFEFDTVGWTPMQQRTPRPDGSDDREITDIYDPSRPTIFTIFNEMGLKLEPQKGPLAVYIVESVQRPTPN